MSDRNVLHARAVAVVRRSPSPPWACGSSTAVPALSGATSADLLQVVRRENGAPTASRLPSKESCAFGVLRPWAEGCADENGLVASAQQRRDAARTFSSAAEKQRTRSETVNRISERRGGFGRDLGRLDKANYRSLAPVGRKGLSAHWFLQVFAASKWPRATCGGAALRTFPMNFNLVRDGARNVCR